MKTPNRTIFIFLCIVVMSWPLQLFAATFDSASNAYERQDYTSAISQFTELAQQNDSYAQYMLGKMFATGEGTEKDYLTAYTWLHLAEISGITAAGKLKKTISKKMSSQKIAKANQLVWEWQNSHTSTKQPAEILDPAVVRKVQQELANRGYYFDKIDGVVGGRTRNAIRRYQQARERIEDGRITGALLDDLHLSDYAPQSTAPTSPPGEEAVTGRSEITVFQKKLRKIIRKAKKRQAADPWLIERLEHLAGYDTDQWSHLVLRENFMARNYQGGEAWRIVNGNFRLEHGEGLIATSENNWGTFNQPVDDLPLRLLDVLIDHEERKPQSERKLAKIQNHISFDNAFALRVTTGTLRSTEGLIFSCKRKDPSAAGYQLVFHPGDGGRAKIFRVIGDNATEIKAYSNQREFKIDSSHSFEWTQSAKGVMTVVVDGQQLLQAIIPEYQSPFESVGIAHVGDRVVFRNIELFDSLASYP